MKHILFILITFLLVNNAFAQQESNISKSVANKFQENTTQMIMMVFIQCLPTK